MVQQIIWGFLLIACLALGLWEISRWRDPDLSAIITYAHKRRRALGIALLVTIACMGYHQVGFPQRGLSKIQSADQALYYMVIMLMVVVLVGVAYYEWKATLVEFAVKRREAILESVADLSPATPAKDVADD